MRSGAGKQKTVPRPPQSVSALFETRRHIIEEQTKAFATMAEANPQWAKDSHIRFITAHKKRGLLVDKATRPNVTLYDIKQKRPHFTLFFDIKRKSDWQENCCQGIEGNTLELLSVPNQDALCAL
jgi:hypothetical protein